MDIAKLAVQFCLDNPAIGRRWRGARTRKRPQLAKWAVEPLDRTLLAEVLAIWRRDNIGHVEGLPENN